MQVGAINLSVREKKKNQRVVLQRGRETWRKERRETVKERERERERDLWEEERPELVTVRVWGEKKLNRIEKKWENLPWEKEGTKTLSFPWL